MPASIFPAQVVVAFEFAVDGGLGNVQQQGSVSAWAKTM